MPLLRRISLVVSLCAVFAGTAAAQVPDSTVQDSVYMLPPIEVVGTIQPFASPNVGSGVPARVTIISGAEIDAPEPRILSDVLQTQAGFSTYDDLGTPYKLNISSRGFYASPVVGLPQGVAVFLDGVRQNEPDAAQVNFDLLPLEHVKRIELLSGNGSLLGRNALGGAVNLVTRRGEGPLNGELELMGGTFGAFSAEASLGATTRDGFDWYAGGGYNREDGWRQVTGAKQYNGFVNLGKTWNSGGLRFQAYGAESDVQTAGSLPESVFEVKPDSNLSANDFEDLNSIQVALLGYRKLGSGQGSFNLFYRRHNADRFNANQPSDPDTFGESRNRVFGGTIDYRLATSAGSLPLGLRFGVDGSTSSTAVRLFADSVKFGGDRSLTTDVESPVSDIAAFGMADLVVGRATFSGGLRYDYVRGPFRNLLDPTRDTTQTWSRLNPRIGADVDLGSGVSVFGSWGTAFRAPSVIEVACADPEEPCPLPFALGDDPPIDPVVASTFELGARYTTGSWYFTGSAYRSYVKNDIILFPYEEDEGEPEGSTIDGYFDNIDKTRREGLELTTRFAFGPGHMLYANYAWTRATFQTTTEVFSIREEEEGVENVAEPGDKFPLVPEHQVKAGINLRFPVGLRAGADVRWIGEQYLRGDEANDTDPLDSYFVADARLGWEVGPWEVVGAVTNLFQNRYATFGTFNINQGAVGGPQLERFLTPGQERQFRLIVQRAFGRDRD
ncbi:MAG TPA: TonB-dependent receptor [Gemmatimonadales bacterium]|nr:TonB-dependent receptor [Gemmatimonadales bacterium]